MSSISKVLEWLIYDQLYEYLSNNELLSKCQSSFRRFHLTTTSLLDIINEWYTNMDQGKLNSFVFLDLSKAFDTFKSFWFYLENYPTKDYTQKQWSGLIHIYLRESNNVG